MPDPDPLQAAFDAFEEMSEALPQEREFSYQVQCLRELARMLPEGHAAKAELRRCNSMQALEEALPALPLRFAVLEEVRGYSFRKAFLHPRRCALLGVYLKTLEPYERHGLSWPPVFAHLPDLGNTVLHETDLGLLPQISLPIDGDRVLHIGPRKVFLHHVVDQLL